MKYECTTKIVKRMNMNNLYNTLAGNRPAARAVEKEQEKRSENAKTNCTILVISIKT